MSAWVVVTRNLLPEGQDRRAPEVLTKEAALLRARSYVRAGHEVLRIEGPKGDMIGKEEIERWIAANLE